ncbi:MAG: hypothetical protein ACOC5T_04540 [Elusimicrobiota bacterium]
MKEQIFIKEVLINNKLEFGLFDSLGFIFTSFKSLDEAISYCVYEGVNFEVLGGINDD